MLGQLPTSLELRGESYSIDPDFRNVLQIISAMSDKELNDEEKVYILLRRLYTSFDRIPRELYEDAIKAALNFIECGRNTEKKSDPKVVDWNKDEQLIFAAVNKVAGREVRDTPMHWWTFLGFYQSIDHEDLFSFVVSIRQKKARHKKLEKYESDFYNANRSLCDIAPVTSRKKEAEDYLAALYAELTDGGGSNGK